MAPSSISERFHISKARIPARSMIWTPLWKNYRTRRSKSACQQNEPAHYKKLKPRTQGQDCLYKFSRWTWRRNSPVCTTNGPLHTGKFSVPRKNVKENLPVGLKTCCIVIGHSDICVFLLMCTWSIDLHVLFMVKKYAIYITYAYLSINICSMTSL